jgi:outer membrane protein insertion porin family
LKKSVLKILIISSILLSLFSQTNDVLSNYRLKKIYFQGNQTFSSRQLRRFVDIRPARTKRAMKKITYRYIKSQVKNLQNYYVSEGFLNCSVKDSLVISEGEDLNLYFSIKEKERYYIRQISIEGNTLLSDGEILELLGVKVGEPFRQYVYYNNFSKILSKYSELGHPFAGIREEYEWGTQLEITLYINEDISYDVDNIELSGNKNVKSKYIEKHYLIKEGEPYQLDKINRTKDRIYEMGAFNSVNIVPINPDTTDHTLDLNVSVIEGKARRFDLELGAKQVYGGNLTYSSLYLKPEWTHKNLFHRAHRFSAGLTYEPRLENRALEHLGSAEIGYTVPWIFFFRLPTTLKLYYERKGYDPTIDDNLNTGLEVGDIQTRYGVNLSTIWRYNRNIYTRASFSLENFKNETKINNILVPRNFEPQTELSLQSRFDNRDNFIYPAKGWNILLYGGYVLGAESESSLDYFRVETSVTTYRRLMRNLVIAGRMEIGQFIDRDSIDVRLLYQMGSESTLRGWSKKIGKEYTIDLNDSTSATIYSAKAKMMANLELRYDLPWNFGLDIFLDAGRLDDDLSKIFDWSSYYVNTGIGLYYKTPIGPIRVEVPILLNNPNKGTDREVTDRTIWNTINVGLLFAF